MKLSAPKQGTYVIAVLLLILAIIGRFVSIPGVSANGFWLATASSVVLALGCYFKGL